MFIDVPKSTVRTTISLNAVLGRYCDAPDPEVSPAEKEGILGRLRHGCRDPLASAIFTAASSASVRSGVWSDSEEEEEEDFITCRSRMTEGTVRLRGIGTGISETSKRVPIFSFATQGLGGKQASSYFRQRNWVQPREVQIRFPAV